MRSTGPAAVLRHRQFRLLFGGQALSGLGDWIDYVALVSLVAYQWRDGAGGLAAVAVTAAVPWLVIAPVAGVWADRLPQKTAMIGCDLVRAGLVLGYLVAPDLPVLLALLAAKTAVGTLFTPAQQSALKSTVPEDALLAATSLNTLATQTTKIAGPALGGVILALSGPHGAFAADAATFVLSALILSRLRLKSRTELVSSQLPAGTWYGRLLRELREGLAFVRASRTLRIAVAGLSATVFLVLMFDTLSPLLLLDLGVPRSYYGAVVASVAVGAAVGSVLVARLGRDHSPFVILGASQAATGTLVAAVGVAATSGVRTPALCWLPVTVGIGLCSAGILVVFGYLVQRATPQELIGRVGTVAMVVPTALQLAAPLAGAALAARVGIGWVLTGAGAGLAVLGAACVWRHPEDEPAGERHPEGLVPAAAEPAAEGSPS
ncbi:MFS transporter [Streptomyces sp. NPDC057616]|uniref:MFS transporter n=1 Tax=Streptomyces sp. NPDC057616 TaxID=3346183 RepID=UPI00369EFF7F